MSSGDGAVGIVEAVNVPHHDAVTDEQAPVYDVGSPVKRGIHLERGVVVEHPDAVILDRLDPAAGAKRVPDGTFCAADGKLGGVGAEDLPDGNRLGDIAQAVTEWQELGEKTKNPRIVEVVRQRISLAKEWEKVLQEY